MTLQFLHLNSASFAGHDFQHRTSHCLLSRLKLCYSSGRITGVQGDVLKLGDLDKLFANPSRMPAKENVKAAKIVLTCATWRVTLRDDTDNSPQGLEAPLNKTIQGG
jgi:hypothetical protein